MKLDSAEPPPDEAADEAFIPPPPPPRLPAGGSTGQAASNSSVTFPSGAADATGADNPGSLDRLRGEQQVGAETQTSGESMDNLSQSNKNFAPQTNQLRVLVRGSGSLTETCRDNVGTRDGGLEEEAEDSVILSKGCGESPDRTPSNTEGENDSAQTSGLGLDDKDSHAETKRVPDQEQVDTTSLNYKLTKKDWVRRESGTHVPGPPELRAEHEDGSSKIANDIQQGEKLLQRLQLVQQRQDGHMSEGTSAPQQGVRGPGPEDVDGLRGCEEPPEHLRTSRAELEVLDDEEQHDNIYEASTPVPSAAEASGEIQEEVQRPGGVFSLADNPDVLEIPFQTNIVLKPFPSEAGQFDWQFSEEKMQKEISQEVQRELVLVNQGKIPGGYSKGEVRQLKETKQLFEAFQQGPMRHTGPPLLALKDHVYPSVVERTRSLEMFSIKTCPVSRAHSLKLYKYTDCERDRSPENLRSRSPTGSSRERARLSPYPKQGQVHRSVDSISSTAPSSAVDTRTNVRQSSPVLKQNPFVKLRPALALKPEVEKDIREAKQREEELRRQRCALYGERKPDGEEEETSRLAKTLRPGQCGF